MLYGEKIKKILEPGWSALSNFEEVGRWPGQKNGLVAKAVNGSQGGQRLKRNPVVCINRIMN